MHEQIIRAELRRLMDAAHPEAPEVERDHMSLQASEMLIGTEHRYPIKEISRIWPIGRQSIIEYVRECGTESQTAYAALTAL